MKKRIVALLCCAAMSVGVLACGSEQTAKESSVQASESTAKESSTQAESSEPVKESEAAPTTKSGVDGKGETITVGVRTNNKITSYEDNTFTQMLEEDLNINIEFVEFPAGVDGNTKLSVMINGGEELPDVLMWDASANIGIDTMNYYGEIGAFIPLNEYIEDESLSPNWYAIPEEDRTTMINDIVAVDGSIYSLPQYDPEPGNYAAYMYWINTDWLEKVGKEIPTTTDELYEVLVAFANEDPNGNGIKDEIPFYGADLWGKDPFKLLVNAFVYYNDGKYNGGLELAEDGKTVYAPFASDAYKEALEYMHKLNEEGLLPSNVFTDDSNQYKATLNAETPIVGVVAAPSGGSVWNDQENNPIRKQYQPIAPVAGPDGISWAYYEPYTSEPQFFITSDAENPELCYQLGEYFYSRDVSISTRWGQKDYDWTDDPTITAQASNLYTLKGDVEKISYVRSYKTDEVIWSTETNRFWYSAGPRYYPVSDGVDYQSLVYDETRIKVQGAIAQLEYYTYNHPENILKQMRHSKADADMATQYQTDIKEFVATAAAEFITGQRKLDDNGWSTYLKELDSLGLQELIKLTQTAYDRLQ